MWCVGHVLQLVDADKYSDEYRKWDLKHLPIIPAAFKYQVDSKKSGIFTNIKKWVNNPKIDYIIHAGDIEREGQLIVTEILRYINNRKPVKRLWSSSLTKSAVQNAFLQLKNDEHYHNLFVEAQTRQKSDWVIGINLSRCVSILMKEKGVHDSLFSLGRVQTSLVSIINKREKEIEDFKSVPFWNIKGKFIASGTPYYGKWCIDNLENIFDKERAEALSLYCTSKEARIHKVDGDHIEVPPPQFYNLTAIQEEANKLYKYSPDKVLDIAQELYLKGAISYPRAQPRVVSDNEAQEFPEILSTLEQITFFQSYFPTPMKDISKNKRFVDGSKVNDHYAIIPTVEVPNISKLSIDEQRVYKMITLRFISAHYPAAVYKQTSITTLIDEQFTFSTKGKQVVVHGWKAILGEGEQPAKGDEDDFLPSLEVGATVELDNLEVTEGRTTAPPRYTQGQLVKVMEQAGRTIEKDARADYTTKELSLGTVATRASIIKQITSKAYIEVKDNLVFMTPKGRQLISILGEGCWISSPITSGNMERSLEEIGAGKRKPDPFLHRINELVMQLIKELQDKSPKWEIQESLQLAPENKGADIGEPIGVCKLCGETVIDKGTFYGCSSFHETGCDFSIPKTFLSKEIKPHIATKILESGNSGLLTGFKKKNKTDEYYDAFIVWDENKKRLSLTFPPGKVSS